MTKKKKIILITVIVAVILAAGTFAAIYLYINRFDASEYVQAVLDTSYKNETDQYVEITGISNKEAEKIFEDNLDATMGGLREFSDAGGNAAKIQGTVRGACRKGQLYDR